MLVAQPSPTLQPPWLVARQAPPSVEFSRQEYWSGLPFPSPGDLLSPGTEPRFPALQATTLSFICPRPTVAGTEALRCPEGVGGGVETRPACQVLSAPSCFLQEMGEQISVPLRQQVSPPFCVSVTQSCLTLRPRGL